MNKKEVINYLDSVIKGTRHALYKGEYGTPEDDESFDYYYMEGYLHGLEFALKQLLRRDK